MSDDSDELVVQSGPNGKKKVKRGEAEPQRTGTVSPEDEELTARIARWFSDGERPSFIKVFPAYRNREGVIFGIPTTTHTVSPSKTYDQPVFAKMANEFRGDAQNDCDSTQQRQEYFVVAYDSARAAREIGYYSFTLAPSGVTLLAAGGERPSIKYAGRKSAEDEDASEGHRLAFDYTRMTIEATHAERQQTGAIVGQVLMLLKQTVFDLTGSIDKRDAQIEKLWEQLRLAHKAADEAESTALMRKLEYEKAKMWVDIQKDGFALVRGIVPGLVESATDGKLKLPGKRSAESLTLEVFLKRCDEKGLIPALFGKWETEGEKVRLVKEGIFSVRQAQVIDAVAKGEAPPESLFALLDGGECAISMEQYMAAQALPGLTQEILIPLGEMFAKLKDKQAAAQAAPAAPSTSTTTPQA